jgi:predicted nucleic acid-binding Zn ribbon protein
MLPDTVISTSDGGQHGTDVDNTAPGFDGFAQSQGETDPRDHPGASTTQSAETATQPAVATVPDGEIGLDVLRRARRAARPARAGSPPDQPRRGGPLLDPADPAAPEPVATSRRARRRRRPVPRDDAWSGAGPHSRDPQALGSVAAGMFAQRGWDRTLSESRVLGDWEAMVGSDVASQSAPVSLREGELRISASSTAWATQLRLLAPSLLARIAQQVGAGVVTSLTISGPTAPSWKHGPRVFRGRGPRDTYG